MRESDAELTAAVIAALTDGNRSAFARLTAIDARGVRRRLSGETPLTAFERRVYRAALAKPAMVRDLLERGAK